MLWPFGYTARSEYGRALLLDAAGHVLAREGDEVELGGGYGANDETFAAFGDVKVVKRG